MDNGQWTIFLMWKLRSNLIQDKSYSFALRILRASRFLMKNRHEYILSKQLLRCGTSVGANVEEALQAQSKKDFVAKMYIALKEASEAHYWIRLLRDGEFFTLKQATSLLCDNDEVIRLITSIVKTAKSRPDR